MASNEEIERIIDSLAFEVEAVPQNNILEVSGTSKATPLNLKIRVRKKDEALFKQGVVSVPKLGHSKKSPEKIRLVSSDQTVLSFKVFVDTDPDKKPVKKRKRFFGGCLSSEDNEDDTYMDSSKIVATKSSEIVKHNFGLSKNIQDMQLHTQKPTMFFGKTCKPGGCLDPPFDEEIYSYEPKACSKISVQSNTEINKHDSTTLQYPYIDTKYSDMYITNSSSKMGKENNVIEKLSGSHSPERENIKDIQRNESDNNISESYTSDSKKILTKLYPGEIVTEKSRDLDLEIESKNMLRSGKDNDDDENKSIPEISLQNKHIKDNEFIDVSEEHKDILGLGSDNIDLQSKTNPSLQNIQDNDENVVTTCLKAGGALTIPILMAGVAKQITTTNHHNGDLSNENEPSDINKEIQKNVNEHLNKNEQSFLINSNGGKKIVTDSLSRFPKPETNTDENVEILNNSDNKELMITDIIGNNYEFPIRKTQSCEDENMDLNENITYMKVNSSLYNLPDKNDIQVLDNNNILQTDPIINDILHNEKEIKSESSKIILGDGYREKPEVNNDEIITFIQSHDQFEYNYIKEIEHQDNSKEIEHQDNSKKIGDGINSKYVNDSSFSPEIENTLIENEDSNYLVLDTAGSDRWDNLNSQQEQNQVPIKNTAGDSGALDNIGVEHTLFIKNNDNDISLKPEYENISLHNEESPSLSINSQNVERLDNLISHEEQNQVSTKNQISDEIARDMDIKHNLSDSKRTFHLSGIQEEDFTGKNIRSNNDVKDQTQDPYNQFVKFQSRSHSKPISEIDVQNSTFSFSQRDSKVKPDVINMDLAFHSYVNDQNQSVIKSLDTLKDIKRQPQDNVTIIKSQFKMFPKNVIKVPIDAHKYMMVQVVASDLQKPSSCPKPEENLSSVPETDVTQTKKQSQLCEKRELETFQTLLSKIYEKQLIPLQRLISDVKKDVDVLASQQLWLKENWHRTKRNNPKLTHSSRKCGCYKKC